MLQKTVRIKKQKKVYNRHKNQMSFKSFAKTAAFVKFVKIQKY